MNVSRHRGDSTAANVQGDINIPPTDHTQPQTGGTAPSFLRNTHDMITFCDRSKRSVASWGDNGTHMIIHDMDALTREVFPAYFKHSNFKSFARQLNFYGFRKIKSKDKECCIYHHDYFQINRADLLSHIQRQTNENHNHDTSVMGGTQKVPTFVNSDEVNELKEKVDTLSNTVTTLNKEIADLKSLVASLADVIRAHDEIIRQPQPQSTQLVHPNDVAVVLTENVHKRTNFDQMEHTDESSKPQAKQMPLSTHDSITMNVSNPNSEAPYSYVSLPHEYETHSSIKRRKFSSDHAVAYAQVASQNQFTVPPSSNIQSDTVQQPPYVSRTDHWTTHPSENYVNHDHHRNKNNDLHQQQLHNVSLSSIDNQTSSANVYHDTNATAECSADQDIGYEDLAWFALFEEDIAHLPDDPTTAPQA